MKTLSFAHKRFLSVSGLLFVIVAVLFAGGTQEQKPTKLDMADQPRQFLAPGNPDATDRTLKLPFSQITIPGTNRVIRSWTFTVYNSNGIRVYEDSRLETRDRGFFGELFNVGEKPKVDIPADLTWDGTFKVPDGANNGQLVPDGNYTYLITIVDDANNRAMTPPFNITIKNTPISIDYIRIPISIFSPAGKRNFLHIEQSGSREHHWEGKFRNADGMVVRTVIWENTGELQLQDIRPAGFDWDGKDDSGNILPEGNYFYTLEGRNRSGAVLAKTFDAPILLSLKTGALKVSADQTVISPNGDKILDRLNFSLESSDPAISTWSFTISDASNPLSVRFSRSGQGLPSAMIPWDGTDLSGRFLPDGKYQANLSAQFNNGDSGESLPVLVEIDTTPPKASISTNDPVFGGDSKPSATIMLKASRDTSWTITVTDKDSVAVMQITVEEPEDFSWEFAGVDRGGNTLPDGLYTISASGRDQAGNLGNATVRVRKDSRAMGASLELSQPILVPNKGRQGLVRITPILQVTDSIDSMNLTITDQQGSAVLNKPSRSIQTFWDWNGKDDQGKMNPDGSYEIYVTIIYLNGTTAQAKAQVRIDSRQPDLLVGLKASTGAFTPAKGTMSFLTSVSPGSGIKNWKLSLVHETAGTVQTFSGAEAVPASIVWDGYDAKRSIIDGKYSARLQVNWENGLSAESSTNPTVLVSSSGPKVELNLSNPSFVPGNIDGPESLTINISPAAGSLPIESWELVIRDPRGKIFRNWQGEGAPPENILWDGLSNLGDTVESGADYSLVLKVRDVLQQETTKNAIVTIDIQVTKINEQSFKIVISSIQFAGYSSDIFKVTTDLLDKNIYVLRRLATILNKFPEYRIRLEGYAVSEYWNDAKLADWEQKTQLLPLSQDRAQSVRAALMLLGVDGSRFTTKGFGGDNPLVPNSDLENRWKNRRVEFYLER